MYSTKNCYSEDRVREALKKYDASPLDYVIRTLITISDRYEIALIRRGQYYNREMQQCDNAIFEKFEPIAEKLLEEVILPKFDQNMIRQLDQQQFLGCLVENNTIFIHYFDFKRNGIQQFLYGSYQNHVELMQHFQKDNLLKKITNVAGEFTFIHPTPSTSERFKVLQDNSKRQLVHLPNLNKFLEYMFALVCDYLPHDYINFSNELGKFVEGQHPHNDLFRKLRSLYMETNTSVLTSRILSSHFFKTIVFKYENIRAHFMFVQYVPKLISACFNDNRTLFFMHFVWQMSAILLYDEDQLDNCAIVYYFRLKEMHNSISCMHKMKYLGDGDQNISEEERPQVEPDVLIFYERIIDIVGAVLRQYSNFEEFAWILLEQGPTFLHYDRIHTSFHLMRNEPNCTIECEELEKEYQHLITNFNTVPSYISMYNLSGKWLTIFDTIPNLRKFSEMIEYIFSFPAYSPNVATDDPVKKLAFNLRKNFNDVWKEARHQYFNPEEIENINRIVENIRDVRLED